MEAENVLVSSAMAPPPGLQYDGGSCATKMLGIAVWRPARLSTPLAGAGTEMLTEPTSATIAALAKCIVKRPVVLTWKKEDIFWIAFGT
jgi:hypothetical protein